MDGADVAFVRHVPAAALRPFVAAAHGYRVPASGTGVHRGLPSRHLTLVVDLTDPLRVSGLGPEVAAHAVVGGLHTTAARIDASRPQLGMQYALTPVGALALLQAPAGVLAGLAVDLAELVGPEAEQVVDSVSSAATWDDRFRLLDAALVRRLEMRPPRSLPAGVAQAWHLLLSSGGRLRVEAVAVEVGWSRRHLAEQFRRAVGLSPKEAARVVRFESARTLLLSREPPPLVDVAVRCGYADQAHLAREWKALAGCSITTWLAEELPFVQDTTPAGEQDSRHGSS